MVNILTGPRNSGKSTRFLHLYQEAGAVDKGLFSMKRFDNEGEVMGYDLRLLPAGGIIPLARLCTDAALFAEADRLYQGRFVFSQSAFDQGTSYLAAQLVSPLWIDEIGRLELRGLGFANLVRHVLKEEVDLTITIRNTYLSDFLSAFSVTNYRIV